MTDENVDLGARVREREERFRVEPWKMPDPLREFEAHGLQCVVLEGPMGQKNGYVLVSPTHPWHKVHYSECPEDCGERWCEHTPERRIDVHGGITWSSLGPDGESWIFGFDTAHYGDFVPGMAEYVPQSGTRWTTEMVAEETRRMAEQLSAIAGR